MTHLADMAKTNGYAVFSLEGDAVHSLQAELVRLVGTLEEFSPKDMTQRLLEMVRALHRMPYWKDIVKENVETLESVVGSPLKYQREPYMRVLRPNVPGDSVGIHRDTHYGATDAEWVLWVPLTEATNGAELTILPGSHREPEGAYPWKQEEGVARYSAEHWLGFMWAPKRMTAAVEESCVPIPCRVGEAILFNTNCVHGIKANKASWTRWSIDIRLVNAAVTTRAHGIHGEVYAQL